MFVERCCTSKLMSKPEMSGAESVGDDSKSAPLKIPSFVVRNSLLVMLGTPPRQQCLIPLYYHETKKFVYIRPKNSVIWKVFSKYILLYSRNRHVAFPPYVHRIWLDCLRTAAICLSRCDLSASHRDRQTQTGLGCRESHNRQGYPLILKPLRTQLSESNQILWT